MIMQVDLHSSNEPKNEKVMIVSFGSNWIDDVFGFCVCVLVIFWKTLLLFV